MVAYCTGSNPIEFGDLGSKVKVPVTENVSKMMKNKKHSENADTSTSVTMNEGKKMSCLQSRLYMSIHKFYVDDSSLDKSFYTRIILNPSDSRYQKVYKVKKITSYPPPPPPWEKKV